MASPLVSLIITTYNRESYLGAAIASVLNQTFTDFELLLWDDGSTDRSLEIARQFAQQDHRIRVIAAPHQGRVAALRAAIGKSRGQYLGWVDSDDFLHPAALAETVAVLSENPEAGMVYTDYLDVDADGEILDYGDRCRIPYSAERLLVDFMTFHFRLLRRSVFDQVGGIDGSLDYVEDYDLCLRLSELTTIGHVPKPLYYYRNHPGNASQQWRIEQILRSRTVIRRALKRRGLDREFDIQVQFPQGRFVLHPKPQPVRRMPLSVKAASLIIATPLAIALAGGAAGAQSITPATGSGTVVNSVGNQINITGGRLSGNGANLFHSFQQFGVPQGQTANFLITPQIQNILGRVVGGSPSLINGLIQVTGGSANLFLLNPAGVVFGPNASLNVPGSFLATTANSVGFGCGVSGSVCAGWFNATGNNDYAALNGNPTAFAFSPSQPGAIVNAGNLSVLPGQSITLMGGTVVNTGTLTAPGGAITLTAVPGANLVRLSQSGSLLNLEFAPLPPTSSSSPTPLPYTPPTLAELLTGGNLTSATGVNVNPDGSIQLTGSNLQIPVSAGTAIASGTLNTAITSNRPTPQTYNTPAINVLGNQVGVVNARLDASSVAEGGTIRIGGDYRGQGSVPNATQTFVDAASTIRADSLLNGNGGRVIVWADGTTRFFGNISARGGTQAGNGGLVEVSGKNNLTYQGTVDVSAPNGTFGTLLLDPTTLTIVDQATGGTLDTSLPNIFAATPDAGGNTVSWGQLAALPAGTAIQLQASGNITFAPITGNTPGVTTTAGVANLNPAFGAPRSLTVSSTGGAVTFANPANTIATNGGAVTISGTSLNLGRIDTSAGFGSAPGQNGGNITLTAPGNITTRELISNGYRDGIGYGSGISGNVSVTSTAGTVTTGNISATAVLGGFLEGRVDVPGKGGNITVTAPGNVTTGELASNGFGGINPLNGDPVSGAGGNIKVTSTAGTITTGTIAATSGDGSETVGGGVNLATSSNGGNITFPSIDVRGVGATGGNVTVSAIGLVQGTGVITGTTSTIATNGAGTVSITHDGGPDNISFSVGQAGVNSLIGNIATDSGTLTGTFPYFPTAVTALNGSVTIQFLNTPPTLTITTPVLNATQANKSILFTAAQLNPVRFDANADNPPEIRIASIATGAVLRINGIIATPGTILPPGAILQFDPPKNFIGTLPNAIVLSATDNIATTTQGVTVVVPTPAVNNCTLTNTCTKVGNPPANPGQAPIPLNNPTPDDRFSQEYETYLGLPPRTVKTIDEQQQILQQIEQETGAKPAIVYIGFVPELYRFGTSSEETDTDQLELVIVTPQGNPVRKRFPNVTRSQLLLLAKNFRNEVSDPRKIRATRYLSMAQQLYQLLIAPIAPDLKTRQINNLVFVLDSGLRSLPMAALHDGQGFLIEKYSVGVMPSFSLTDTRYQDIRGVRVLGMGISESTQNQPPLPAVPIEVSTLVNEWTGRQALNTDVTLSNLKTFRQQQPYGIIHLATHANFQPGAISNSYIQLWDDKLRLNQVNQLGWSNPQIELLVLSACATALGDRDAELGFGGLAVQTGVKTAVASLWYVSDDATTALMTDFYRTLRSTRIKAEALRQAQLALAKGKIVVAQGRLKGPDFGDGIQLPTGNTGDRALTHPYYWAAFTMIGSPW
jgi:filamentous hemagglutinin family protein